jgi:hypothetical protein
MLRAPTKGADCGFDNLRRVEHRETQLVRPTVGARDAMSLQMPPARSTTSSAVVVSKSWG